jgi:hypothetical protein
MLNYDGLQYSDSRMGTGSVQWDALSPREIMKISFHEGFFSRIPRTTAGTSLRVK